MKATIIKLNFNLPTAQAVTANSIAVAFSPPGGVQLTLSDELEIDLERLDVEQDVINLTTGQTFVLKIPPNNVHDLNLPMAHGKSRFPSLARRRGQ
jgi:hypothetical protein